MAKAEEFAGIVKIGRTHLQDATPLTLGQEVSGWAAMLASNIRQLREGLEHLRGLAIGGTEYGHHTLTRFFAMHAGVLPGILAVFLGFHIALDRPHLIV